MRFELTDFSLHGSPVGEPTGAGFGFGVVSRTPAFETSDRIPLQGAGGARGPQSGLAYVWKDGVPVLPPMTLGRRVSLVIKRAIDIAGASVGLLLLAPLLLLVAVAVRLGSKGPILFRQDREGYRGQRFSIFKFRTMYVD